MKKPTNKDHLSITDMSSLSFGLTLFSGFTVFTTRIHQNYIYNVTQYTQGLGQNVLQHYWGLSPKITKQLSFKIKSQVEQIVIRTQQNRTIIY